ncbi:hypothetical protein Poli38472_003006 [Pythium oligandrum]|uniref:SAP domain-containing protein n=1 Tax=Pythium oligandrum TaxID=41045 RepID=A0A8K1C5Q8_PYTOL|nr:hypothetical protein Poli38472_003006 [Pythium oligandrum]|eukprot:TMW57081.1 hypothetical protein Poli38472_003006 [Pythium oligandrum]
MGLLRRKKLDIRVPTGKDAVNFRKLLFLAIKDSQDLLSNSDWERLDLRCLTLMKTRMLRASCIARGLPRKGGKRKLVERLMASLTEQKNAEFLRRQQEEEEYQWHLDLLGGVWTFGSGFSGQLGHGDLESSGKPRLIKKLRGRGIAQVYAGFDSDVAFAVGRNGDVYVWGKRTGPTGLSPDASLSLLLRRSYRGSGEDLDSSDEEEDAGDTKPLQAGLGRVEENGAEESDGDEEEEDGGDEDFVHPVKLFSLCGEGINHIAVGRVHCCAKTKDGDVYTWGHNDHCQLGYEPTHNLTEKQSKKARVRYGLDTNEPCLWERTISEACVIQAVAVGTNHTFVVTDRSEVMAFGQTFVTDTQSSLSRSLAKLQVVQISCGAMHAGLVTTNGQAYTWGSGDGGRLGHGDTTSYVNPKLVEALQDDVIFELSCACWHTVAIVLIPPLLKGGLVYTWGSGRLGQLAQGGKQISTTPGLVTDLLVTHVLIKKVCAGMFHNVALSVDDEVFTWGSNTNGCLGRPDELGNLEEEFCAVPGKVEVACGREFTLIATKPYIGPTREELERRAEEQAEKVDRITRESKNVKTYKREQLDRIRRDKINVMVQFLNKSFPKCSICTIGTVCPGFQRDDINPAMCKHCLHERRKHDYSHSPSVNLAHLAEVTRKLAIEIDCSSVRDIELEEELADELEA